MSIWRFSWGIFRGTCFFSILYKNRNFTFRISSEFFTSFANMRAPTEPAIQSTLLVPFLFYDIGVISALAELGREGGPGETTLPGAKRIRHSRCENLLFFCPAKTWRRQSVLPRSPLPTQPQMSSHPVRPFDDL